MFYFQSINGVNFVKSCSKFHIMFSQKLLKQGTVCLVYVNCNILLKFYLKFLILILSFSISKTLKVSQTRQTNYFNINLHVVKNHSLCLTNIFFHFLLLNSGHIVDVPEEIFGASFPMTASVSIPSSLHLPIF